MLNEWVVDWLNKVYKPDSVALAVPSDLKTVSEVISLSGGSISIIFSQDDKPTVISKRDIEDMIYAFIVIRL